MLGQPGAGQAEYRDKLMHCTDAIFCGGTKLVNFFLASAVLFPGTQDKLPLRLNEQASVDILDAPAPYRRN